MKILIAHDGSECANAALDDLQFAGLPQVAEVRVLSVGETSSQLPNVVALAAGTGYYFADDLRVEELNARQQREAQTFASQAADRLRATFPTWYIEPATLFDAAHSAIVRDAATWKPDLVVVGSSGRSGFRRFLLGSVSRHVLTHTHCSVRIGRRHSHPHDHPIRLLFGTDGSTDATAALRAIATREWPARTEVGVAGVLDYRSWLLMSEAELPDLMRPRIIEAELRNKVSKIIDQAAQELAKPGLIAIPKVLAGNPGMMLVAEAEQWDANCIFVGARGLNALERVLLGSVSTTVAVRAHCSVEVVRQPAYTDEMKASGS